MVPCEQVGAVDRDGRAHRDGRVVGFAVDVDVARCDVEVGRVVVRGLV